MSSMARTPIPDRDESTTELTFESVYDEMVGFVWRTARRLGVEGYALDDVCQQVFVAVHRGLPEFGGVVPLKAWVFRILQHSVRMHREAAAKSARVLPSKEGSSDPERTGTADRAAYELVSSAQALRIAHKILESLTEEKREVFVLVELEQWSPSEAAIALGVDADTVNARLRLARKEFALASQRIRIRDTLRNRDSWRAE